MKRNMQPNFVQASSRLRVIGIVVEQAQFYYHFLKCWLW